MRPRLLLALITLAALLAAPPLAFAHAELESATPGPSDEVVGSPAEIVAEFSQDLDMSRTAMSVRDSDRAVVAEGPVLGEGPRELRLALPELPPGEYEVRWTSFSAEDSELERGSYTFTVLPAPSPTAAPTALPTLASTAAPATTPPTSPAPTPTATPGAAADGGVAALLPIGIAAVVLLAIGAWLLRRR